MENRLWAGLSVIGVILAAAYLLWLYQRVFFGTVTNPKNEKLHDLTGREILTFAPLVIMAFWIGLYPKPFFEILEQPVNQLVQNVRPGYPIAPTQRQASNDRGRDARATAGETPALQSKPVMQSKPAQAHTPKIESNPALRAQMNKEGNGQ
jgi:NADH-quinone oxidoreductase subunit M